MSFYYSNQARWFSILLTNSIYLSDWNLSCYNCYMLRYWNIFRTFPADIWYQYLPSYYVLLFTHKSITNHTSSLLSSFHSGKCLFPFTSAKQRYRNIFHFNCSCPDDSPGLNLKLIVVLLIRKNQIILKIITVN